MMTTITRVFLGWTRQGLLTAVDFLVERFGGSLSRRSDATESKSKALDLGEVVVVVTGSRVGRRLLELLVDRADREGLALRPPAIVTIGRFPEYLYTPKSPLANGLTEELAWVEALRRGDSTDLKRLCPILPAEEDLPAWQALAEMPCRLHRELAGEGLDFQEVVRGIESLAPAHEVERWQALSEIQKGFLAVLEALGLADKQFSRLEAIRSGACVGPANLVLLATADLTRAERLMLDQITSPVTALVVAPSELEDRFDGHGCLRPEAWQETSIAIQDDQIEMVEGPAEQAAAAVRAIAAWEGRYRGDEISVGVLDSELAPYLQQQLAQCELPSRYAFGLPSLETGPARLLTALAAYLAGRRYRELAALVRLPAVADWLLRQDVTGDWLSEFDRYYSEHLPVEAAGAWLAKGDQCAMCRQVIRAIDCLLSRFDGEDRPLGQWGQPIMDVMVEVFGAEELLTTREPDRTILAACGQLGDLLRGFHEIPPRLEPKTSAAEAIRLVLRDWGSCTVAPPAQPEAIELLGWLELPLDDAPALVVTGMNEGRVPQSINADMFLPNQLRRELSLEDNDRRLARDAYALSVLTASRRELHVIAARRSAEGDALAPSRLLFACDEASVVRRTLRLFGPSTAAAAGILPGSLRPGRANSKIVIPRPEPLAEPVRAMRVTEFRDYLACPYRYYLRHRLKLEPLDDTAEELDGAAFGLLAHGVLRDFASTRAAASTSPEEIARSLSSLLDRMVREQFGLHPLSAIRVQVEQLRRRLGALAGWQADRVRQGWRIEWVETGPKQDEACLVVDGEPMFLHGRIDRIDVNDRTGQRTIFDYKTSDTPKAPDKTHRNAEGWTDLQLPLYRHLAAGMGIAGPVQLGYICLPKDTSQAGESIASWSEDELREADRTAEMVVRNVRAQRFWPPTQDVPFADEFSAICMDRQFGPALEEGESSP